MPTESEICQRFLPLLRAFGRRHLRDRAAADELAQESLVVVLSALRDGRIAAPEKIGGYVLGVARNLAREGYRQERRDRRLAAEIAPLVETAGPPTIEVDQRLRHCISQLTARARAVLHRAIIDEETAAEIALALGLTEGNVRVIRHRALAEVRKCMQTDPS